MIKKQLIMEKALELFAENGIEATSIQQITERCGISKGAFYLSFKSKNELIIGLIDNFMSEIVADIEQSVNSALVKEKPLYNFYYATFQAFHKHADFVKTFMKEPSMTSCEQELLERLSKYNEFINAIVFSLVERQFSKVHVSMRADLVFIIKCFMKHYTELFFFYSEPIDFHALCNSLVEKTTIIAEHATIPFISTDYLYFPDSKSLSPKKEQLVSMLSQKKKEALDPIIQQSLELLKNDLVHPQLPPAIIQGLLKNLRSQSHSKWVAYLYELYLKQ